MHVETSSCVAGCSSTRRVERPYCSADQRQALGTCLDFEVIVMLHCYVADVGVRVS